MTPEPVASVSVFHFLWRPGIMYLTLRYPIHCLVVGLVDLAVAAVLTPRLVTKRGSIRLLTWALVSLMLIWISAVISGYLDHRRILTRLTP